jgi:delta(3,5)-delta(2,4)-dienoyl-CoA isomerase
MSFNAKDYQGYANYIVSEIEPGFAHVQLNNPKTLNAFDDQFWRDYSEILLKLDATPEINIILISSNVAKAFTSGLNLKNAVGLMMQATSLDDVQRYKQLYDHIGEFQYCIGTPARIRTPTIGLLNGINYGLALDMSATYTIRIATACAKFSIREIKIGIPADIGSLQRLPSVVNNISLLNQYALTGEDFYAEDALKLGFVSKIVPDLKTGLEYCKELGSNINSNQQWAIKGTKDAIQKRLNGESVSQGLQDIQHYNAQNIDKRFIQAMGGVKL